MATTKRLTIEKGKRPRVVLSPVALPEVAPKNISVRFGSSDFVKLAARFVSKGFKLTELLFTDSNRRPIENENDETLSEQLTATLVKEDLETFYKLADENFFDWQLSGITIRDQARTSFDLRSDGTVIIVRPKSDSKFVQAIEEYLKAHA